MVVVEGIFLVVGFGLGLVVLGFGFRVVGFLVVVGENKETKFLKIGRFCRKLGTGVVVFCVLPFVVVVGCLVVVLVERVVVTVVEEEEEVEVTGDKVEKERVLAGASF